MYVTPDGVYVLQGVLGMNSHEPDNTGAGVRQESGTVVPP